MWHRPLLHVSYLPIQVLKTSLGLRPPGPAAHPKVGIAVLCFIIDVTLEDQVERKA